MTDVTASRSTSAGQPTRGSAVLSAAGSAGPLVDLAIGTLQDDGPKHITARRSGWRSDRGTFPASCPLTARRMSVQFTAAPRRPPPTARPRAHGRRVCRTDTRQRKERRRSTDRSGTYSSQYVAQAFRCASALAGKANVWRVSNPGHWAFGAAFRSRAASAFAWRGEVVAAQKKRPDILEHEPPALRGLPTDRAWSHAWSRNRLAE